MTMRRVVQPRRHWTRATPRPRSEGTTLTITTDGSVAQVAGIFVGLEDARIEPTEFSQKLATLDDAFLKITATGGEER